MANRKPVELCPHCQQEIKRPKIAIVPPTDTALMSDAEVYKHYKATDRIETLKFWIASSSPMSAGLRAAFGALYATITTIKVSPAAFDQQFKHLRNRWREESNARELANLKASGYTYDSTLGRWELPTPEETEPIEASLEVSLEEIAS